MFGFVVYFPLAKKIRTRTTRRARQRDQSSLVAVVWGGADRGRGLHRGPHTGHIYRGKSAWLGPFAIELPCPFCLVEKRDERG
ncbi:hypothetical protein TorRG33x02_085170 [Trema orientale]|uniref:Uncharacterized protein n=1 Tax=Trema orientale TaxID=63057 RepID=A0A2P5FD26_TREOI|nr:hypothetical protein TorRG33x02_085170 [Trema orientale]